MGATKEQSTTIAPFSRKGPTASNSLKPNLVAPGEQIVSLNYKGGLVSCVIENLI